MVPTTFPRISENLLNHGPVCFAHKLPNGSEHNLETTTSFKQRLELVSAVGTIWSSGARSIARDRHDLFSCMCVYLMRVSPLVNEFLTSLRRAISSRFGTQMCAIIESLCQLRGLDDPRHNIVSVFLVIRPRLDRKVRFRKTLTLETSCAVIGPLRDHRWPDPRHMYGLLVMHLPSL